MRRERRLADERGTALVELALLLPFLAVLIFGTVDVGRGFSLKNRLTNMAREGAFVAQYRPCDTAAIEAAVADEDPDAGDVTVTVTGCGAAPGDDVVVTVTQPLTILTPLVAAVTGSEVDVSGSATVVRQG